MDYMPYVWIAVMVIMAIFEGVTTQLVSVWFVVGALAAFPTLPLHLDTELKSEGHLPDFAAGAVEIMVLPVLRGENVRSGAVTSADNLLHLTFGKRLREHIHHSGVCFSFSKGHCLFLLFCHASVFHR